MKLNILKPRPPPRRSIFMCIKNSIRSEKEFG